MAQHGPLVAEVAVLVLLVQTGRKMLVETVVLERHRQSRAHLLPMLEAVVAQQIPAQVEQVVLAVVEMAQPEQGPMGQMALIILVAVVVVLEILPI